MRDKTAIRLFHTHHPKTFEEARDLDIPMKFVGAGVFREVYHIIGSRLVAKFPLFEEVRLEDNSSKMCNSFSVKHTRQEVRAIELINKNRRLCRVMRVPYVYYFNSKTGVMLVEKVRVPDRPTGAMKQFAQMFMELFRIHYKHRLSDIICGNIGVDEEGEFVVIDLGL